MATSEAQREANRANAQHSTGPSSDAGKKRSSMNATRHGLTRHGLTGQVVIASEEEQKAYDAHCSTFFHDWQPQGATEKHLVQTIAAKQWQMHLADSLVQAIYAVGQDELSDKVDTEHPHVHDALTAGMFTMQNAKQLDLLGRYASRLQRDHRSALKDLQTLQGQRKQREQQQMAEAVEIAKFCDMNGEQFDPADFGFVLHLDQIDFHLRRDKYLAKAKVAAKYGFDFKKYMAATGS